MIKNLKALFLLLTFAHLMSCAFYGPEYKKPHVNAPTEWHIPDPLSKLDHQANLPMMAWWKTFDDPELSHYIKRALHNNNDVHAALGNIIAAQGQLEQVQFSWIPIVNTIAGDSNVNNDMLNSGYNLGFMPSYAFNIFQFIRSKEFATANLASANAAKNTVRLTVISQTVASYFTYLGQSYLLEQQKQLVTDLRQLLFLSKMQEKDGLISLLTLQQYEQQYEQAKAQVPIIAQNVVVARNALHVLMNENPGAIKTHTKFMDLKTNGIIPVNLPSKVLKNRPDVQEAEQNLIAANANIGVATSAFFPTIFLTSGLGTASNSLSNLFANGSDFWNYQAGITMPLLNAEIPGQIKRAKGEFQAQYFNYMQIVREAFASVDNSLAAHENYYLSFEDQVKNEFSTQTAYNLTHISYEKGLYSYPTVLNSKVTLDNARISVAKAKLAQLNSIVALYENLGGGYE
jgi:outer membrane protein, multidrug efflux system